MWINCQGKKMSKDIADDLVWFFFLVFLMNMMKKFLMKRLLMRKIMSKNWMINQKPYAKVCKYLKDSKVFHSNKLALTVEGGYFLDDS